MPLPRTVGHGGRQLAEQVVQLPLPGGRQAAAQPLLAATLAVPLLGERLRGRALILGLAGVAGVGLVVLGGSARLDPVGILAGLTGTAAMAAMAGGVVLTKQWRRPVGVVAFTGGQLTAGGVLLLPLPLLAEGLPAHVTAGQVGGFAYLAAANTALACALWVRGIGLLPATQAGFLPLLSPVVATAVGWALLGQALGASRPARRSRWTPCSPPSDPPAQPLDHATPGG